MSCENKAEIIRLVEEARKGSPEALDRLIQLYEPLTASLVNRYRLQGGSHEDAEDVRQELLIVFCNAVMTYNLSQNDVEFGLYAKICMERGLITQLRAMKRRIHIEPMPENEPAANGEDLSRSVVEGESVREMWKLIRANLSDYENKVWDLHLSGHCPTKISALLGRDIKSTENALCRIRAKLRKAIKKQYR